MNRLLGASLLLFCIAGTGSIGCSGSKSPTTGGSTSTGGKGGGGGVETATGGIGTSGGNSNTQVDAGPQDTAIRTIEPSDTDYLLYSGRIDFTDPTKPLYSAPGVVISARFTGVSVTVKLKDSFKGTNFFEIVVDHDPNKTYIFQPKTSATSYNVVSDLPYGEHLVEFVKRTEASQGAVTFLGFDLGGALLPAPTRPTRKIEIIGDSISTGSGDEPGASQVSCNTSGGNPAQNAYLSYGAVLARNLNAEYYITSAAGRGAMRNYECGSPDTLPAVYDHIDLHDMASSNWDYTKFVPDAIILALGTNDFSPDQCAEPPLSLQCDPANYKLFISTMEGFISKLHGYYNNAQIIMTSSPMLTDSWPDPVTIGDASTPCPYTSRTSHIAALHTILSEMQSGGGASYLHVVDTIPKGLGRGCGTHPNVSEQGEIGGIPDQINTSPQDMLLNPVKTIMGW